MPVSEASAAARLTPVIDRPRARPYNAGMPSRCAALERHAAAGARVAVGGLSLFHRVAGPEAGVPVVLVHGLPHSSFLYRGMIPALAALRPVRAPDLPGFGLSDKPAEPARYSLPAIEVTLGRYLDALGSPQVHLVCHDISGPPGAAWAAKHQDRVASLTLLNTTLTLRGFRLPGLVAAGIALPWALQSALLGDEDCARLVWAYARLHAHARPEGFDGEDGEAFRRLFLRADGRRSATWLVKSYWGAPAYLAGARAALASFSRPMLVLWGARDPFCTPRAARRLAALVPGSRLELIGEASHFLPEDAPDEVVRRLALFWKRG